VPPPATAVDLGAPDPSERVRAALLLPQTYPHRPPKVEIRETHISWVFLAGDRAYKLKKPLTLDFLDYGTATRRRQMCNEEVRLNRRLAPDIYGGVRGVALTENGVQLTDQSDPRAVDFLVEMRRFDERQTIASKLRRGELEGREVIAASEVLADFHASARRVSVTSSPVLKIERQFERNLHELLGCVEHHNEVERVQALERFAQAFISRHAQTLRARAGRGYVREGHGDLRAEHVLLGNDQGVEIVDCIEFDRGLRELDVGDDLAFLVFDVVALGGARYADLLVRAYRDAGGTPGEDSLISFYATYRALVRAKVALVRAAQQPPTSAAYGHHSALARDLIGVAERFAWRARLPLVIAVCGVPASGKSCLARRLEETAGLPHLSSDVTRKRLVGQPITQHAPAASYSARWNLRTYAELGRRAAKAVDQTGGAIVDATFRHATDRQAFASAFGSAAPTVFVECQAPRAVLARRASLRRREPGQASDADVSILLRERDSWEPLDEVPANTHVTLRTDRSPDETVADLLALLDRHTTRIAPRHP
jgi:uncharacterized protein